jgi:hypothetical protein
MKWIDVIDKLVEKLKSEVTTLKLVYVVGPCVFGITDILPERSSHVMWLLFRSTPKSLVTG